MAVRKRVAIVVAVALAVAVTVAVGATAAFVLWGRAALAGGVAADHAAAVVVLSGPNRLVTVDLEEMRVVADVPLRSLALDVAVDEATGIAVTAQTGGVSYEADDVAGLFDVRRGGKVEYVKLPLSNPSYAAARSGVAYLEHGWETTAGMAVTSLDLASRKVRETGHMPTGPGAFLVAGEKLVYSLGFLAPPSSEETGDIQPPLGLVAVSSAGLVGQHVSPAPPGTCAAALGPDGEVFLFGGPLRNGSSEQGGWFAEVTTATAEPETIALPGLLRADVGCVTPGYVVAASWGDEDPTPGQSYVGWFDRRSRTMSGRVEAPGGAGALASWKDRVVIVELDPCRLVVLDPTTSRVVGSVPLDYRRVVMADVDVLP